MLDKEEVIVKLLLLVDACRNPRITKKQVGQSLQSYINKLKQTDGGV